MPHPLGATSGVWDIEASLRCPIKPHPSFGSAPHVHGRWWEEGTGEYRLEAIIRAFGTGAKSGSGVWMLRLPRLSGYQMRLTVPDFDDGDTLNSWMIGYGQVGALSGRHYGPVTAHTRSTFSSSLEESENNDYLVFAKKGGLFIGGGSWTPANLHFASHRPFACTWVAV